MSEQDTVPRQRRTDGLRIEQRSGVRAKQTRSQCGIGKMEQQP